LSVSPPPEQPPEQTAQEAPVCYRHTEREAHIRCQRCNRPICPDCMRPAAVGFQCPECVKEGARTTRSGRTPYGGSRSGNPALTSQILIGINVAVWIVILATGGRSSELVRQLALTPIGGDFSLQNGGFIHITGVANGAPWQLVTSMFTHVEVWHIGFNMLVLWVLGPQLELAVGRIRYLAIYFISGLAGSAAVMWLSPPYGETLGASGAIFGLMGALLVIAIKVHGDVRGIATWIGVNLVLTLVLVGNVSWQGHLGGLAGGVLTGAVVVFAPREHRAAWQAAGLSAVTVLVLLASAARVAVLT
jgi:membrane associated rhomboid family serine protease